MIRKSSEHTSSILLLKVRIKRNQNVTRRKVKRVKVNLKVYG